MGRSRLRKLDFDKVLLGKKRYIYTHNYYWIENRQVMKSFVYTVAVVLAFCGIITGQEVVSVTPLGTKTKAQLTSQFNIPFITYGARYYKVTYTSADAKGNKDTLSGMIALPDVSTKRYPRLVYTHGTSDCKTCVPSRYGSAGGDEGQLGLLFAGLGFVTILPDYVGMGDGRGFQTYVHAATTVSASDDMLRACDKWFAQNNIATNTQLFLTGYSQGGFASMAYHKYLEETFGGQAVTAAAHLSGAYDVSGVMRNLILSQTEYFYPAYIPNTVLGYNEVTGTLYNQYSDFFKADYIPDITSYYNGSISLSELNARLISKLTAREGASIPGRMIRDDVYAQIRDDLSHPANAALRENDVYKWAPKAPTRLFYCKADDQVPYQNAITARDTMVARGATNLLAIDVNSTADHGGCVVPAFTQTMLFFLGFQQITSGAEDIQEGVLSVYPVPAGDELNIDNIPAGSTLDIMDITGRPVVTIKPQSTSATVDISLLSPGIHLLVIRDNSKKVVTVSRFVKS